MTIRDVLVTFDPKSECDYGLRRLYGCGKDSVVLKLPLHGAVKSHLLLVHLNIRLKKHLHELAMHRNVESPYHISRQLLRLELKKYGKTIIELENDMPGYRIAHSVTMHGELTVVVGFARSIATQHHVIRDVIRCFPYGTAKLLLLLQRLPEDIADRIMMYSCGFKFCSPRDDWSCQLTLQDHWYH